MFARIFTKQLPSIPESIEMSTFNSISCVDWSEPIIDNELPIPNRLSFKPMVCNWLNDCVDDDDIIMHNEECRCNLYNFPHNENIHYEEDTSFFPDPMGNIVKYGEYNSQNQIFETCMSCDTIQDNNILIKCCRNDHYFCTECFFQEKCKAQRHNVEYELQKRRGNKESISQYQFTCPECNISERLNFSIFTEREDISDSDDIEIISAIKL
jgi:hypothetical protein